MSEDLGSAAWMGAAGRTGALKARALYTGRRSPAAERAKVKHVSQMNAHTSYIILMYFNNLP